MRVLRWLLAAIVFVAAVVMLVVAVWVGNAAQVMFTAETYKRGLADQSLYQEIVPLVLPTILESTADDTALLNAEAEGEAQALPRIAEVAAILPEPVWRSVANSLVPPTWMQTQTETALDAAFAWLHGDDAALNRTLDFNEVERRLRGEQAAQAVETIIGALPQCSADEIETLRRYESGTATQMPLCSPPASLQPVVGTALTGMLAQAADAVERYSAGVANWQTRLQTEADIEREQPELLFARFMYAIGQQLLGLLLLCPAGLLAFIVVIIVRSFRSFGGWIGGAALTSALLAALPLTFLPVLVLSGVNAALISDTAEASQRALFGTRVFSGMLTSAFQQITPSILVQSGLLFIVGLILIMLAAQQRPPQDASGGFVRPTVPDGRTMVIPS